MPTIQQPQIACTGRYTMPAEQVLNSGTADVDGLCIEEADLYMRGNGISGYVVEDVDARNFGLVVKLFNMPQLRVSRVKVTDGASSGSSIYGIGIGHFTSYMTNVTFQDLIYRGDPDKPTRNIDDAWAAIALRGRGADDIGRFSIDRFDFQDLFMEAGTYFQNVDGISTERGYSGTITNGRIRNASDACLDLKGDVSVNNVYVEGCYSGMKLWDDQDHGLVEIGPNRSFNVIGKGTAGTIRQIYIETLILSGDPDMPMFRAEDGIVHLTVGTLIADPDQVLNADGSYPGSSVTVNHRINP